MGRSLVLGRPHRVLLSYIASDQVRMILLLTMVLKM